MMSAPLNNANRSRTNWQFSLRCLFVVMTVVAIGVMLVTHHFRIVIGFITIAYWIADLFFPLWAPLLASLLNPRRWPPFEPTEAEKQKFAARFAKRPDQPVE